MIFRTYWRGTNLPRETSIDRKREDVKQEIFLRHLPQGILDKFIRFTFHVFTFHSYPSRVGTTNLAIDLHSVSKIYKGRIHALRGIDMAVHRGEIFGLLGPN